MKGLLIKDFKLMKVQKRFFIIIALIAVLTVFTSNDLSFIISYIGFVTPIFALTTLSYDEFDNGYPFIFTLPVTRKEYVLEKYLFGLLLIVFSFAVSVALVIAIGIFKDMSEAVEAIKTAPVIFAAVLLMLSFMLPLQIKFGAEKGRIAMLIATGGLFAILFGLFSLVNISDININLPIAIFVSVAAIVLIVALSVKISILIINNKDF